MTDAWLCVGHGTRDPAGVAQCRALMDAVLARLAQRQPIIAEKAFLELVEPDIVTGIRACVTAGATRVTLIPLLLLSAGHWKNDIPKSIRAAQNAHGVVEIRQANALGSHAGMLSLLAQRLLKANLRTADAVLLVGRGSHDPEATAAFTALARAVQTDNPIAVMRTAVMVGLGNTIEAALNQCGGATRRVLVIPYLLFSGRVLTDVVRRVELWSARHPAVSVEVLPCLWPDPAIADAFANQAKQALPEVFR